MRKQKTRNCNYFWMMNKLIHKSLIYLSLLVFFGCKNEPKNETLNLEEIRPKSNFKSRKNVKTRSIDSNEVSLLEYKNDSIDLKISRLVAKKNDNFLNRFPSKKNTLRTLFFKGKTIQIQHESYEYSDSIKMKNAFFNWLDCNGKECRCIKLYEETKIEPQNLLVITTGKSIDIIRSESPFKPEDWIDFIRFSKQNNEFSYIIFQKKNRNAQWFEFNNFELVPKKNK